MVTVRKEKPPPGFSSETHKPFFSFVPDLRCGPDPQPLCGCFVRLSPPRF